MHRPAPLNPRAALRVDLHMVHYGGDLTQTAQEERIQRLAEKIAKAVSDAIYEHAEAEFGPDTAMAAIRQAVHARVHAGLGPAWHPDNGSEPWIPGTSSAPSQTEDFSLECADFYEFGQRHVAIVADWS